MTGYGISLSVLPFHIERMALAEGITAEASSVHVGLITGLFALMQFFFAPMTFVLFLTALFGLGMALLIPMLATMVSRRSVTGAGAGLGMQNAVNSLGQAIGPVAGGLLFTLSIHLPYLLARILLLVSTGLLRISVFDKAIEMKD